MSEGELYKRCFKYRKTICVHVPEEDEKGEITQKFHDAYRPATREEIKEALDEARREYLSFTEKLKAPPLKGDKIDFEKWEPVIREVNCKREKWFLKQFGSS